MDILQDMQYQLSDIQNENVNLKEQVKNMEVQNKVLRQQASTAQLDKASIDATNPKTPV